MPYITILNFSFILFFLQFKSFQRCVHSLQKQCFLWTVLALELLLLSFLYRFIPLFSWFEDFINAIFLVWHVVQMLTIFRFFVRSNFILFLSTRDTFLHDLSKYLRLFKFFVQIWNSFIFAQIYLISQKICNKFCIMVSLLKFHV